MHNTGGVMRRNRDVMRDVERDRGAGAVAVIPAVAGLAAVVLAMGAFAGPGTGTRAEGTEGTGPAAVADADPSTRTSSPLPEAPAADALPVFEATVASIDDALATRMGASWRPGCPVPLTDLRYVTVSYVDFDGAVQTGEVVVHAEVAESLTRVFARLFELRYPIRSMRLVDDFGASDDASMAADNSSAFNCRPILGGTAWSEHSYGRAIDINPVENPYVKGSYFTPDAGAPFVDRVAAPGVILADDAVVQAFAAEGWFWGGAWLPPYPQDYQHFSTTDG